MGLYGIAALALTVRLFRVFDEKIDRPRRWDQSPSRGPGIDTEEESGEDATSVFIDDDANLELRYGERVPVLRDATGHRELDWPFDEGRLRARFLE